MRKGAPALTNVAAPSTPHFVLGKSSQDTCSPNYAPARSLLVGDSEFPPMQRTNEDTQEQRRTQQLTSLEDNLQSC